MLKNWLIGAVVVALVATLAPTASEAKRLGGGKSSGMQRDMPARTAPDAPAGKPATPAQGSTTPGAAAAPAAAGATGAAAAAGKKSWLGPIAGIAAAVGLVALMSHLGLGEAFANFMMLALLAVAVIALVVFIRRKMAAGKSAMSPAMAGSGNVPPTQVAWPNASERTALNPADGNAAGPNGGAFSGIPMPPESSAAPTEPAPRAVPKAFVPAAFDSEGFARIAKMIFIRLQAANDAKNLDDLRQFTTPEMFAALKMDLLERGDEAQETEVKKVDAQVLDVGSDGGQQIVSVRFTGDLVEERGGPVVAFDEVWHLVKPEDDSRSWAIAGIEQSQ
ncbi:MAG: Tim44 domain-containing protein [Rubrivivax sp.]|jgi:predicted lipid-binding transport protein (Tim44 family)|nr:39S ribosomal protein L45 [Rubrivivax sp.]